MVFFYQYQLHRRKTTPFPLHLNHHQSWLRWVLHLTIYRSFLTLQGLTSFTHLDMSSQNRQDVSSQNHPDMSSWNHLDMSYLNHQGKDRLLKSILIHQVPLILRINLLPSLHFATIRFTCYLQGLLIHHSHCHRLRTNFLSYALLFVHRKVLISLIELQKVGDPAAQKAQISQVHLHKQF